jgi:D-lactate dehydrogenase (cytochrome)
MNSPTRATLDRATLELRDVLHDRVATDDDERTAHAKDCSSHAPHAPDVVVFPRSTSEVSQVVKICGRHKLPIIPFGAGTAVEGGVLALQGGVTIDLRGMNRILSVHADDLDATVEAGVTRKQLNTQLAGSGLFFSVDPGADATIGGMAATRASGTNAVRYGTMRENVLALEVVMADGQVINTARRARKSSAGYDLTRLMVGSEGTLGVITAVTVRLQRQPEAISSAVCSFPSIAAAVEVAQRTIQATVPVARIELLDEMQVAAFNRYSQHDYPETPTLFFEFHGTERSVVENAERVQAIATSLGGQAFRWSTDAAERERLWEARHNCFFADLALRPGCVGLSTDVCVPISRLAECITKTREDLAGCTVPTPIVGHVGDGNFHVLFIIDPNSPAELAEAERYNQRIVRRALDMDGTCTGEHGIGIGKLEFMAAEHGAALDVMRAIKNALDPLGIMNPGKVVV